MCATRHELFSGEELDWEHSGDCPSSEFSPGGLEGAYDYVYVVDG